jgi:hypothetical protein
MKIFSTTCLIIAIVSSHVSALAGDWTRFRGSGGAGYGDERPVSTTWSESENLKWKAKLPGPGSSSPIVVGKRVFVTCYSGYGASANDPGAIGQLRRHLVCIDRSTGNEIWSRAVKGESQEDQYRGFITEHGYASSTPVTDGKHVFAFFGKSGVIAFDMEGKQLWHVNVGTESSNRRWGSAASLILYKNTVIVNASEESQSIRALNTATGKEVWKAEAGALDLTYGTPTLVKVADDREELIIAVPGEVWGMNPETGKLRWFAETKLTGNISPTVQFGEGRLFAFGGYRGAGSLALRPGGKDDVTASHVDWTSTTSSYVATPILHKGHLYWADDRGIGHCLDAKTGKSVYRERLAGASGFGGRPVYASPVISGDKIFIVSRWAGTYVIAAKPEYELIGRNQITSDETDFNATPAISGGQLFLRSNLYLYCVAADN